MTRRAIFPTGSLLASLTAAAVAGDAREAFAKAEWKPVFQGVERAEISADAPRLIHGYVLRVNLKAPGVSIVTTPDNGEKPGETDSWTTSTFLKNEKCQAAVNAAPYWEVFNDEGKPQDVKGLQVRDGKIVSAAEGERPALVILKDGTAAVQSPPFAVENIAEAVGGFETILTDGANVAGDKVLHPRTGAGVSKDGTVLYLVVVDGRQKSWSGGCTTVELADWLQAVGAWSGINLDGGGTTAMALAGADGAPVILNRPIHRGKPGLERPGGSHLGVRAKPLE